MFYHNKKINIKPPTTSAITSAISTRTEITILQQPPPVKSVSNRSVTRSTLSVEKSKNINSSPESSSGKSKNHIIPPWFFNRRIFYILLYFLLYTVVVVDATLNENNDYYKLKLQKNLNQPMNISHFNNNNNNKTQTKKLIMKKLIILGERNGNSYNKLIDINIINNLTLSNINININNNNSNNNLTLINNNNNNNSVSKQQKNIHFGTNNLTILTYQVGSIAVLPCVVNYLNDETTISWIRKKDYHLLTVGMTTYSSDERFSVVHLNNTEDWTLQIKFVQNHDSGLYECQVTTHPPISIFLQLNVVEARAIILGQQEKYLKPGSILHLICKIEKSIEPSLYIFWYHNNRMINYDMHRGINVSTVNGNTYSELLITQTSVANSGNYSCVPNNAVPASIFVHILNGENPAAMQHGDHNSTSRKRIFFAFPLSIYFLSVFIQRIFL